MTFAGSSSALAALSRSSKVASADSFHSSSILRIMGSVTGRERICSLSVGCDTSQVRKEWFSIRGCHSDRFHCMSLLNGLEAQG